MRVPRSCPMGGEGIRGILKRERPVVARWTEVKEAMARDILLSGWNPRRGAFTQSYGEVTSST